jgi:hypothetical protein
MLRKPEILPALRDIDYRRIPVSPEEFLSDRYYLGKVVWDEERRLGLYPVWKKELIYVLSKENSIFEWVVSGSLGAGKTTAVLVAFSYWLYFLSCLRDPHAFLGLMADSPIEFFFFNITLKAVEDTALAQFEGIINGSPYFKEHFPPDKRRRKKRGSTGAMSEYKLEFPPYFAMTEGSQVTHFTSRNIILAMLDEANFAERGTATGKRFRYDGLSKAYQMYTGLRSRIRSRFLQEGKTQGFLALLSSAASEMDFLEQHKAAVRGRPSVHVSEFSRWEASPWKYSIETFRVFVGGRRANSRVLGDDEEAPGPDEGRIVDVPVDFREDFEVDLTTALREVAGIPAEISSPLIPIREQIEATVDPTRTHPFVEVSLVVSHLGDVQITDFLRPEELASPKGRGFAPRYHPSRPRHVHVDIGVTNDSAGVAMGCLSDVTVSMVPDREGRIAHAPVPHIWIDFMLRLVPPRKPEQVSIAKIRTFLIYLRDVLKFNISTITYDGYQSTDSIQILQNWGFPEVKLLSVDKKPEPYKILRGTIMEKRLSRYAYLPFEEEVGLLQVEPVSGRVDHLPGAAKDVSDSVAGVCFGCSSEIAQEGMENLVHTSDPLGAYRDGELPEDLFGRLRPGSQSPMGIGGYE